MQNEAISCPICQHPGNGAFCGMCGSRMVEEAATVAWCLKCGFKHASAAFCPQCGNPMANGQIGNSWSLAAEYPSGDTQALEQTEMLAPQGQAPDALHHHSNNAFQKHEGASIESIQKERVILVLQIVCFILFFAFLIGAFILGRFGFWYNEWVFVPWVASIYGVNFFRTKNRRRVYSIKRKIVIIVSFVLISALLYITVISYTNAVGQLFSHTRVVRHNFIWQGTRYHEAIAVPP